MNNLLNKLKVIKAKQVIYPTIVCVFVAIVAIFFALSAKFLSTNINKAFITDKESEGSELVRLDLPNYFLIAKKLGLNVAIEEEATPPPQPTPVVSPATTTIAPSSTATSSTAPTPEEKAALKIEVLNSTGVKGLGAAIAKLLQEAGFSAIKIGNQAIPEAITKVMAKEKISGSRAVAEIRNIVSKKYTPGETQALPEESSYDVVIVIGNK